MAAQLPKENRYGLAQNLIKDFFNKNFLDVNQKPLYSVRQDPSDINRMIILRNDMKGQELSVKVSTAHDAPVGWKGGHRAGNKALIIETKHGNEYVMGATGIGKMESGRPAISLMSPIESFGNLVNASFMRVSESRTGSGVMKQFQYGMQHGIPKFNVPGGLQILSRNQQQSQALGVLSSDLSFMYKAQDYTSRMAIQKELLKRMTRPGDPNWSGLEAHVPREPSKNMVRFRVGGEVSRHGTATRDTLIDAMRQEKQAFGSKYLSFGVRNQLAPIVEQRQSIPIKDPTGNIQRWREKFTYKRMQATPVTKATFNPLRRQHSIPYVRWNAVYGGENLTEMGDLIPQESLAGTIMVAPTLYSGAAIAEGDLYKGIYGAQYEGLKRATLRNVPFNELLEDEGGLQFTEAFRPGGLLQKSRNPRGHGTIGYLGKRPIKLGLKQSDFLISEDQPLRMLVPATYRDIDQKKGNFVSGQSTEESVKALQKKYPNLAVEISKDVDDITLLVEGGQITGFSEKGTIQRTKSGIVRGKIGTMKVGDVSFQPSMVTGEAKSLPWMMGASFGVQPYENQLELLGRVDPQLAERVSQRYQGVETPVIDVRKAVQDYEEIAKAKGLMKPEMKATQIGLFSKMLAGFMGASEAENVANIKRFGIGRTGEQWVSSEASSDTKRFFQHIIKNTLQGMYPEATPKQIQSLAKTRFRFKRNADSGNYTFMQKTSGMIFPGVLGMAEEWAGDLLMNYEGMSAVQTKFPKAAQQLGVAVRQGPMQNRRDLATRAWASVHQALSYEQANKKGYGNYFSPTSMVMMNQEKAEEFLARLQTANYNLDTGMVLNEGGIEELPDETQIGIFKEVFKETFPGADPMSPIYSPQTGRIMISPSAAEKIASYDMGVDVSRFGGKYMRAFTQVATAEKRQDASILEEFKSLKSYDATLNTAMAGKTAESAMKRLLGRRVQFGASHRYVTADFLKVNESFFPNETLEKMGLNVEALNRKLREGATIPVIQGRFPTLDPKGGAIASKLVTEEMLRLRGVKDIPTVPTPGRKGDPAARDTAYVSHLFSRLGEGDIDKDLLWTVFGIKAVDEFEEIERNGQIHRIKRQGYKVVDDPALMAEINAPIKQRIAQMESLRKRSFGQYAEGLDVYSELVKAMMTDPYAEATKSANRPSDVPYSDLARRAQEINIMNKAGMGKAYNIRRQLESQMSMIGTGYGKEDVSNMYISSKYTYQQYLDLLRKEKEGFSPLEELLQTANISTKDGRITAKVSGKPGTKFWPINMGDKWDLSGFLMGTSMETTASNEFLSYLLGSGKEGAEYIQSQLQGLDVLKQDPKTGDLVPNTKNLNKRNEILNTIMREGKYINESSPINRMLTERIIEKARTKGTLGEVQHYSLPWKGQATPISNIMQDPDYIRQSTAYRLLKRNKGNEMMSADDLYELKRMADEKIAQGIEPTSLEEMAMAIEDINQFESAKELFDIDFGARQETMAAMGQEALANLITNPILHASEVARTAREIRQAESGSRELGKTPNYRNIQGLTNVVTRSMFGRDVTSMDAEIFGKGEHAEWLVAQGLLQGEAKTLWNKDRGKIGSWIGGREAKSGLFYQQGNTTVEANPDFFALEYAGETEGPKGRVKMYRPVVTEAKSRNPKYYEATKKMMAGEEIEDPKLREATKQRLQESLTQADVYKKAIDQTLEYSQVTKAKLSDVISRKASAQQRLAGATTDQQKQTIQDEINSLSSEEKNARIAAQQAEDRKESMIEQIAGEHLAGEGYNAEELAEIRKILRGGQTDDVAILSAKAQSLVVERPEEGTATANNIRWSLYNEQDWKKAAGNVTTEADISLIGGRSGAPQVVSQVSETVAGLPPSVPATQLGLFGHTEQPFGISTKEDIPTIKGVVNYAAQAMGVHKEQINLTREQIANINRTPPTAIGTGGSGEEPPTGGQIPFIPMPEEQPSGAQHYQANIPDSIARPNAPVGTTYMGSSGGRGGGQSTDITDTQAWKMSRANEEYQRAVGMYSKFTEGILAPNSSGQVTKLNTIGVLQNQLATVVNNILGSEGASLDIASVNRAVRKDPSKLQQLINSAEYKEVLATSHQADKALASLSNAGYPVEHPYVQEILKMVGIDQEGTLPSTTGNINFLRMAGAAIAGIGESPVNDADLVNITEKITKSFNELNIVSGKLTGTLSEAQKKTDYFQNTISKLSDKELRKLEKEKSKELEKDILTRDIRTAQKELEKIKQQPPATRETEKESAYQKILQDRQAKLGGILQQEQDVASGKAGLDTISANMRKLVGGWGLFYMKTLATMGMGSWAENYKDVEQYMTDTQQVMGRTLGAGVGIRRDAATALHRARIRGGAGAFEQLQQMKASLADTALGDLSGAALTGVGFSILGNYALPALGLSANLALPLGLAAGAGALAYNRWATATSPTASIQVGSKYLDYMQSGKRLDALNYVWQGFPTLMLNEPAYRQGMQFGALANAIGTGTEQTITYGQKTDYLGQNLVENYMVNNPNKLLRILGKSARVLFGRGEELETQTFQSPKNWQQLMDALGGDKGQIALFNQMFAANEELFAGYSPEILTGVLAEQQAIGAGIDLDKIRNIAGARQLGIDTSGLAGAMVSQFGATLPSGEFTRYPTLGAKDNWEEIISQMNIQETGEITGGLEFLSQLSNAGYFKERLTKELTQGDKTKAWVALGRPDLDTDLGRDMELLKQIAITQQAQQYKGVPQEERIVRGLNLDAMLQMAGLQMPETDIEFLRSQTSTSMSAEQIRQFDTKDLIKNMAYSLQSGLTQSTTLSTPETQKLAQNFIDLASKDLVQGLEYMNRVNLIQNKNPYIVSEMFSGINEDLVSVDINEQGQATGLPLYTTRVSEAQAQGIWGSDWKTGDITGLRDAAVKGIDTKRPEIGTLSGIRGMQWLMQQTQWEYQQQAMGIAASGIALQREYMPKFWGIEDRQRALSHQQQLWQFGQQEASMAMSQRQQFENWGLQQQSMQMNQAFTRQGWAYQDKTRNLQWGWKVEDFQENVRFMTGRERRLAERQMARETTMHNLEGTQIDKQRQQQEEIWDLQEAQFEMSKKHFAEQQKFQEEALERQKQFYEEGKALQDESIALHREYQEKQLALQEASIGLQREQAEKMHEMQIQYEQLQREQDDHIANWQMISLKQLGFVETALLGLDTFEEIRKVFQDMWDEVTGGEKWTSPIDTEKAIEDIVGEDNMYKALGGFSENVPTVVGEVQSELLIPPQSSTIIPVTKLRSPWSDQVFSNNIQDGISSSEPSIVKIYIGNQHLGDFIIDTVEKEIRV